MVERYRHWDVLPHDLQQNRLRLTPVASLTDVQLTAEMLSYSRARGLFAGIDLSGGVIRQDKKASASFYGREVSASDVLFGRERLTPPPSARSLMTALNERSPNGSKHGA